eukprot:GFUD01048052.1.p1 GENE.GFUD01048052.1~~GFUD01048052.1.p1  ORF type:complete len:589 (-),score=208.01 GFUD01048052.1:152-1918(-)
MRMQIQNGMQKMMEDSQKMMEMKAESGPTASYILETVMDRVMVEVEDNPRRMNNLSLCMQQNSAGGWDWDNSGQNKAGGTVDQSVDSADCQLPPSPDYRPASPDSTGAASPDYRPASPEPGQCSPDYTPAPTSPDYIPASPDNRPTSLNLRPGSPLQSPLGSKLVTQGKLVKSQSPSYKVAPLPPTHYQTGCDSPMANPSPAYQPALFDSPDYRPVTSPAVMDMDSAKFKCSFCMEKFDIVFEVYEHLQDMHEVEDNEEVLKQHCIEPNTATYAPVTVTAPYTETEPTSQSPPEPTSQSQSPPEPASQAPPGPSDEPVSQPGEDLAMYQCGICQTRMQGMFLIYEHLEEVHDVSDEEQMAEKCTVVEDDQIAGNDGINHYAGAATPPLTPPPVSTIQLVPAGYGPDCSDSGDSGAISDEEEEIAPPTGGVQLSLPQGESESVLLAIPRTQSGTSATSSSRSASPFNVETMDELQDALSRDGDFKFLVSLDLTKTDVYRTFMEKYARDAEMGEKTVATFHLKQGSDSIEENGENVGHDASKPVKEMEIGNVSPEVVDRFCPLETFEEKENPSSADLVKTTAVEMETTDK